jgi:hypothetical protein
MLKGEVSYIGIVEGPTRRTFHTRELIGCVDTEGAREHTAAGLDIIPAHTVIIVAGDREEDT